MNNRLWIAAKTPPPQTERILRRVYPQICVSHIM